jgi:ABC-type antimicrobial peptide transport system permease subunit
MILGGRLDGHLVQGHVDATGTCMHINDKNGSWEYRFRFPETHAALVIEKGSICINGISLTAYNVSHDALSLSVNTPPPKYSVLLLTKYSCELTSPVAGIKIFDPMIYFLTKLPSEIDDTQVIYIILISLFLSFCATIYPAWRVSKTSPATILRY